MSNWSDIRVGDKSHLLTVVEVPTFKKDRITVRCDCGNQFRITQNLFVRRIRKSCGCAGSRWRKVDALCDYCLRGYLRQSNHTRSTFCSETCRNRMSQIRTIGRRQNSIHCTLKSIVTCSKARCKRKGREHDITVEYLERLYEEQDGRCALSGTEMIPSCATSRRKSHPNTVSVDRIDCNRGYVEGNVRLVTIQCNTARSNFDDATFVEMCKRVVQHSEGSSQEGSRP